jgi:hypothetical protein
LGHPVSFLRSRLDRLTPVLTAKERAILALRAQNAGQERDPELLRMPEEQRRAYDHYVGLVFVATAQLGALLHVIGNQIDHIESDLDLLAQLDGAASIIEAEWGQGPPDWSVKGWRKRKTLTVPEFLRGLSHDLSANIEAELALRWQELRAVEIVWDEIALEFDGEDAAHPDLRARAAATKEKAVGLAAKLHPPRRKLPKPKEELVAMTRNIVDQAFDALGLVKDL